MKLFKCTVCNYTYEAENASDKCPLCGAPKEKMPEVSQEQTDKIFDADITNDIHMEIIDLAARITELCEEGIEIDLDPMCVKIFDKSKNFAWDIKQMSKAEIENHTIKKKW